MATTMTQVRRFTKDDEEGFRSFLRASPRAVVMYRGVPCPFSRAFEDEFAEFAEQTASWSFAVREVEHGGDGPVGESLGVEVTPTVGAFHDGNEVARLEAKTAIGITKKRFATWLEELGAGRG